MTIEPQLLRPWRLLPNRVARFYRGGLLLDEFRGNPEPVDTNEPESWIGSATPAWTAPEAVSTGLGLADAEVDGRRFRIADVLAQDPAALVGAALIDIAGPTPGLLVKLLDAGVRLPVHAHPDRAFARRHLASYFGKAEAWLVTGTREAGDPLGPGIWLGFRRDLSRAELLDHIESQDADALLGAMHRRPAAPGDVWFVPPGTPHAIGAGIFIVEIQEPTDFSIVAETRGLPIDREDANLRLGWDVAVDAIDRTGHDDAWVDGLRHVGARPPRRGRGWRVEPLIDAAADPYFRAERLVVEQHARRPWTDASWLVGVVMAGQGRVSAGGGTIDLRRGDTFAIPAAVLADATFESWAPDSPLVVTACRPPDPVKLDRWSR